MNNNNNSSNETNVDWVNVILLKDLNDFLYKSDIIELSLASKIIREKLAPFVFNYILVDDTIFASDIDYFGLTHEYREKSFSKEVVQRFRASDNFPNYLEKRDYKSLVVDPYLKSYKERFEPYSKHVKSFTFNQVFQPLYYLIDLLRLTTNLNSLYIDTGFLLIKEFQTILDGLQNLKDIILNSVTFVKFESDKPSVNALSFPKSLQELTVFDTKLITRCYKKGAYQLLFEGFSITPEPLPIARDHLPDLRYLEYDNEYQSSSFVGEFLRINPQINSIKIPFTDLLIGNLDPDIFSPATHVVLHPSKFFNHNLNDVIYLKLNDIPIFEFTTMRNVDQGLFYRIISSFKNLKILHINLDNSTHFNSIENIIIELNHLKFINVNPSKVIQTLNSQYLCSRQRWFELSKLLNFADKLVDSAPDDLMEIIFNFTDLRQIHTASIKKLNTSHMDWGYRYSDGYGTWYRKKYALE
ncbi:hypothetical protein CONCODRAFT_19834 [Conidiobolus coronatus NRRL 28638]|uniref:F-box domain-containing protein n=1 Tax=Conidiobolus coronatus (strain ATCC 28846 / CBS 209.66 / NRRL 28638) TaxID=796925 RepID=A0A137NWR9_CONC2|nr:hypothetical protein CONCODRAFT_19834 [Conidiobolus coronatus NRRL 28638]|eukprot:KXN67138.1 hypothetical protein CONCODRAFT_19834 [Conidiobolus coronatus NRRL 28638]